MRRATLLLMLVLMAIGAAAPAADAPPPVVAYYLHREIRCVSCLLVEEMAQWAIEARYAEQVAANLSNSQQNWAPIRSTRGVVGLVRIGDHVPVVPEGLIRQLKDRSDERGVIPLWDQSEPDINQPVEITAGPFTGYRGIFTERSGQQRALILLEILNAERSIEVPLENVRKI